MSSAMEVDVGEQLLESVKDGQKVDSVLRGMEVGLNISKTSSS